MRNDQIEQALSTLESYIRIMFTVMLNLIKQNLFKCFFYFSITILGAFTAIYYI